MTAMKKSFKVLVGLFLWIFIILPIISVPLAILYLWLLVARFCIWVKNVRNPNERIQLLNICDLCYFDPGIYGFLVAEVKGPLSIEDLRQRFFSVFLKDGIGREKYPIFYTVFEQSVLGFSCKKVKEFSDERLLQSVREDYQEENKSEAETLERIVRDDSRLKGDTPKWEVVLIKGSLEKSGLLFKFHHSLFDGYCARFLWNQLLEVTKPGPTFPERKVPFLKKLCTIITAPFIIYRLIKAAPKLEKGTHPFLGKKQEWNPEGTFQNDKVTLRVAGSGPLDFRRLRNVVKRAGVKTGSILLYLQIRVCEETLRRNKTRLHKDPDAVVVATLSQPPNHPLEKHGTFQNYSNIYNYVVPLSSSVRGGRLAHLKSIDKNMRSQEASGIFHLTHIILNTIEAPKFVANWIFKGSTFSLFCSPFPLAEEYKLLGLDVVNITGGALNPISLPQNVNRGCSFAFITSGDVVLVSSSMSDEMVSSQQEMEDLIRVFLPTELESLFKEIESCNVTEVIENFV